jgi:enoyl-CoA hydratase/carnithine racemase
MLLDYKKEGKIAIFTLNRPDAMNALNPELFQEMSEAFVDFKDDDNLWVGIVTGAGQKAFCAGADIKTMLPVIEKFKGQPWGEPPIIMKGLSLWKPLIAAVNGAALGGGMEVALACDIRIAAENAIFGVPEVTLGLIPAWGGTQRLPRAIPAAKAAEMLFTGKPVDAQEAYRIGLVNRVVPQAELMPTAMKMAETICKAGPLAVRAAKQAMVQGVNSSMEEGLLLESVLRDYVVATKDFAEGCKAFLEKRKAEFKGE